jgi:hypothetical protein
MRRLRAWGIRLGGMFTRRRRVEQFDEELQSILEMHVDEGIRRGLSPDEARRNAHIAIGGLVELLLDTRRHDGGGTAVQAR